VHAEFTEVTRRGRDQTLAMAAAPDPGIAGSLLAA
jgi:hypothetical protein